MASTRSAKPIPYPSSWTSSADSPNRSIGIDLQLLSPNPLTFYSAGIEANGDRHRTRNQRRARRHSSPTSAAPVAAAQLPDPHIPSAAADELARAVGDLRPSAGYAGLMRALLTAWGRRRIYRSRRRADEPTGFEVPFSDAGYRSSWCRRDYPEAEPSHPAPETNSECRAFGTAGRADYDRLSDRISALACT